MASLTDQLPTINSGKSIIADTVQQPSFMAGLADVAQGAGRALSNLDTAQRQAKIDARKDGLLAATNEAEQNVFNEMVAAQQALNGTTPDRGVVPIQTVSVWGQDVNAAAGQLNTTQKAVAQGRAAQGAFDLQLERITADLFQKHPEYKADIAQYMQGRGFDSYVFRDLKQQAAFNDQVASSERQAFKENYDYAVSKGVPPDPNNPQQTAMTGSSLRLADYQRTIAKEQYEMSAKMKAEGRTEYDWNEKVAEKDVAGAVGQEAIIKLGAIVPTLANLISSAGDDQAKQSKLSEIIPMIPGVFASYKTAASAQIKDPVVRKALEDQIDELEKSTVDMYSGPLSQYKVNAQSVSNMSNQFALKTGQAMPIYSSLKASFGAAAVNEMFGGNIATAFPPETLKALQHEFDGLKTADAREGQVILNNLTQILKGDKKLKDLSEREARKQMPLLTKTAVGAARAVTDGSATQQDTDSFAHSYSELLNAAVEVQPAGSDINSVLSASSIVSSRDSRNAVVTGIKQDESRFTPIMLASRGTAAHLLEVSKGLPEQDRFFTVAYDERTGRYWTKPNTEAIKKASQPTLVRGEYVYLDQQPGSKPTAGSALTKKVDALNLNLNHLVETAKYDKDLPPTTPLQLAKHYAIGAPIGRTDTAGKPAKSATEQFNDSADAFKTELRALPSAITANPDMSFKGASISSGNAVSRLVGRGVPKPVAAGIVARLAVESGLDTGGVGDGGKAKSLAQWHPDRQAYAKSSGYDLSNPDDAIDFVLHELNTTEGAAKKALMKAKTPEEAYALFTRLYERPADPNDHDTRGHAYARQFASTN